MVWLSSSWTVKPQPHLTCQVSRVRPEDSHVQATLSVQIAGTKRWRLMPLRRRRAPFLAMYRGGSVKGGFRSRTSVAFFFLWG